MIVFLLFKLTTDPFDCGDCHLAWLIRNNQRLLPSVANGVCSNGTRFEALDPSGYENCPVIILLAYNRHIIEQLKLFLLFLFQAFTCPLGYDGDYADPTTCSGYYICRANVAYKSVNIKSQYNGNKRLIFQTDSSVPLHQDCPADLVFNSDTNQCDLVSNVEGPCGQFVCPSADGQFANPSTCSSYYLCIDNDPILLVILLLLD